MEFENNNLEIIDGSSSEKWNFDEIDKILEEYKESKKFGKIQIVFHMEQKNHSEVGIDFKLNNNLVHSLGNYIALEQTDQKILLSIFQSDDLKKIGEPNYYTHIGKNWFSAHFIGDVNNPIFKNIDKTITWISNNPSKMCVSLQQIFNKYIKKFNESNK
ncbi:hypothetical protein DICPUDRAFT_90570 [Dictyostelium purpureum]|uniref:Uncharacterized protein n=1 Tax=Dictyostelium purpureum TaxID=5786 RepID=F1A3H4_DICPU|nr:uncharacterized protein DICPUDRAFT_90570 [Dictyostelium purpureum]EGC29249.1 hypothetical protein DICPUDRAFT_90570 [Dictyostelium purpureum]|eukprot:XP_003294218.1 hypothetical protein DICPUDRAFT_90570 [Dictyostelium purpureum]